MANPELSVRVARAALEEKLRYHNGEIAKVRSAIALLDELFRLDDVELAPVEFDESESPSVRRHDLPYRPTWSGTTHHAGQSSEGEKSALVPSPPDRPYSRILSYLQSAQDWQSPRDIAKQLDLSLTTVSQTLPRLRQAFLVDHNGKRIGSAWRARPKKEETTLEQGEVRE